MHPIYDLDQSVRDDVSKLRADSHIKASTGAHMHGREIVVVLMGVSGRMGGPLASGTHCILREGPPHYQPQSAAQHSKRQSLVGHKSALWG